VWRNDEVALVFTIIWLIVLVGFAISLLRFFGSKAFDGRYSWKVSPFALVFAVLLIYLVTKLIYEEILPCVTVDSKYCDFTSIQYRNLFGWEF
jgi:purine-cytosine permease-like protein